MAVDYIEALRVIQPEGPYLLGGWSYGGIVAFEMARKLQAQGQQVALLALIDSGFVIHQELVEEDDAVMFARLFHEYYSLSFEYPPQLSADELIVYAITQVKQANLLPSDFDLAKARSFMEVHKGNNRAAQSYVPQPYSGRVTLFRAAEQLAEAPEDLTLGLGELASLGVDLHIVPGKHLTILHKPNVQVLAEQLKRCFTQAQAGLSYESWH
jgi:thioesterase domain-containing protein